MPCSTPLVAGTLRTSTWATPPFSRILPEIMTPWLVVKRGRQTFLETKLEHNEQCDKAIGANDVWVFLFLSSLGVYMIRNRNFFPIFKQKKKKVTFCRKFRPGGTLFEEFLNKIIKKNFRAKNT